MESDRVFSSGPSGSDAYFKGLFGVAWGFFFELKAIAIAIKQALEPSHKLTGVEYLFCSRWGVNSLVEFLKLLV